MVIPKSLAASATASVAIATERIANKNHSPTPLPPGSPLYGARGHETMGASDLRFQAMVRTRADRTLDRRELTPGWAGMLCPSLHFVEAFAASLAPAFSRRRRRPARQRFSPGKA